MTTEEMQGSPAFAALSTSSRRVLVFILGEIGAAATTAPLAIPIGRFEGAGINPGQRIAACVRELHALGLIERTQGPRRASLFARCERWREIGTADEAAAVAAAARAPAVLPPRRPGARVERRPKPEPEPPIEEAAPAMRPVTLWQIPWPQNPDAGL